MKISNAFSAPGAQKFDYDITKGIIEAVFADPEKRDDVTRSIIVHNLAANISNQEALRIMDYSEERITKVTEEIREEKEFESGLAVKAVTARAGLTVNRNSSSSNERPADANNGDNRPKSKSAEGGNNNAKSTGT